MCKQSLTILGPDPARSQGGMATVVANMLGSEALRERYEVAMYPTFVDGPLLPRAAYSAARALSFRPDRSEGALFHIHVCSGTSTWRKTRYVARLGAAADRAVLHVHGARYHTFLDSCSRAQLARVRSLFAAVGRVVVLSEEWEAALAEHSVCNPAKVEVVHNAVEIPHENLTDYGSEVVLFMGRLGERKGADVLLRAARIVLEAHPGARFVFGGDGDVGRYRALARDLDVSGSCEFVGWAAGPEKERLFRGASIYCLPSRDEGMPMSVLEAMSYGLATVTTPVGGVPRVVADGADGLLVPVGDHEALARALTGLLDDPARKRRIGEAGRRTVEERFGMGAFARSLIGIYDDISGRASGR